MEDLVMWIWNAPWWVGLIIIFTVSIGVSK